MAYTATVEPDALSRSINLPSFAGDVTFMGWMRQTVAVPGGEFPTFFYTGDDPLTLYDDQIWVGWDDSNGLSVFIKGMSSSVFTMADILKWHHIAYTRTGTTHRLYVNGSVKVTHVQDVSAFPAATDHYLGTDRFAADWNNHQAAYWREWDVALTEAEVQAEMRSAAAVKVANLQVDTPLQGDFLDDSGNGNHWSNMNASSSVAADGPEATTRFYFTKKRPNHVFKGRAEGPWIGQTMMEAAIWNPIRETLLLDTSKTLGGTIQEFQGANNHTPNRDSYVLRFVSQPLAAQTVDGTFDWMNFIFQQREDPVLLPQGDAEVRTRVYIYVTQGNSTLVRGVLLDHVDATEWPRVGGAVSVRTWTRLTTPAALTAVAAQDGDRIMVEVGFRVVSMPVVDPTYPPTTWTHTFLRLVGTQDQDGTFGPWPEFADAVDGETVSTRAGWCEFTPGLVFATPAVYPGPPVTVGTFANPIQIAALPYRSPEFDTTGSTVPGEFGVFGDLNEKSGNALYFQFTATQTGYVFFMLRGCNYPAQIGIFNTGGAEGSLAFTPGANKDLSFSAQSRREIHYAGRCGSSAAAHVTSGNTYLLCVANMPNRTTLFGSGSGTDRFAEEMGANGGIVKVEGYYRDPVPLQNDLYVLIGALDVLREIGGDGGEVRMVNLADNLITALTPTGIAIDYTRRSMVSFGTESVDEDASLNHTGYRVLIGSFTIDLQEIFPIDTLSWMPNKPEIDFMDMTKGTNNPAGGPLHQTNFHVTRAGILWTGNWGDGFQLVTGEFSSGSPPAILDAVSSLPELGTAFFRDVIQAESQPGAPWPDGSGLGVVAGVPTPPFPDVGTTSVAYITIDEDRNRLYYTSSGEYSAYANPFDVDAADDRVYVWDLNTNSQLPALGPFPLFGSAADSLAGIPPTAGLRGIQHVAKNNTILVVNSDRIMQIDTAGNIIKWFVPQHPGGLPGYNFDMIDIVLTAEQDFFWAKDGGTGALYKFNLETGAQTNFHVSELITGTTVQMQIFLPAGFIPPTNPNPCPEPDGFSVGVIRIP